MNKMLKPLIVPNAKEKSAETQIIDQINLLGGYVVKNQASGTTGRGKPDLSACLNGEYYGIEVKRYNNKQIRTTKEQLANLSAIDQAGGYAFWAKSASFLTDHLPVQVVDLPVSALALINHYLKKPNVLAIRLHNQQIKIYSKR